MMSTMPALLTVFNSILGGNGKRVIKYARSEKLIGI
jgi:hypothetical protein